MENYRDWLGKEVKIIVDRQLGSKHPQHHNLVYELNYGYVPDTKSEADNEEIDAYILGIEKPVNKYIGKVIAIIKRNTGDQEIKLVVTDGTDYTNEEIKSLVNFQEKFFEFIILK